MVPAVRKIHRGLRLEKKLQYRKYVFLEFSSLTLLVLGKGANRAKNCAKISEKCLCSYYNNLALK